MAFCTARELVEAANAGKTIAIYQGTPNPVDPHNWWSNPHPTIDYHRGPLTLERAREILNAAKEWTKAHRQMKINRPYELLDITADLDRDKVWMGWEIECGWADQANYDRVIDYLWRHHDHVTIDIEGAGLPTEITFSPAHMDDFKAGKSQVHRFLRWVKRSGVDPAVWSEYSSVGTHLNVSTPTFRSLSIDDQYEVVHAVNELLGQLPPEKNRELFGRSEPYDYGFVRGEGGEKSWVEFKLFNSTLDIDEFNGYCAVAEYLVNLIDMMADKANAAILINVDQLPEKERQAIRNYHINYPWVSREYPMPRVINAVDFVSGKDKKLIKAPILDFYDDNVAAVLEHVRTNILNTQE